MKRIFLLTFLIVGNTLAFSQDKDAEAKVHYTNAEDYFNQKTPDNDEKCITELAKTETVLGNTNSKILYLKIKAMEAFSNEYFAYDIDSLFKIFFKITDSKSYPEDKYSEIIKIKSDLSEKKNYSQFLKSDYKSSRDGKCLLGEIYFKYFRDFKDERYLALSLPRFQLACKSGSAEAADYLAWVGVEFYILKNNQLAEDAYSSGAECGSLKAMTSLGEFYGLDLNGPYYDINKAKEWLLKAANSGNVDAMKDLGDYYFGYGLLSGGFSNERHSMKDKEIYETGFNWYLKAAEGGNVGAIIWVVYYYGHNFKSLKMKDKDKEKEWSQKLDAAKRRPGF
jgi:hypothetical protein